jgi:hypothetical protein
MLHENKYDRSSREQDEFEKLSHFGLILLQTKDVSLHSNSKQTLNIT